MTTENSFRNRIIQFQNQAEQAFEEQKSFSNTLRYILAFIIFMLSTFWAALRLPFALLGKIFRPKARQKEGILTITDESIDKVLETHSLVLIDFWAEWCGPCIMMNPILKQFADENEVVKVGKVNADTNSALVKRYKIRGLPQILLIKDGVEIKRNAGALSIIELTNFVKI